MLVRKQILFEEEQDMLLQKIAYDYSISYSEVVRQSVSLIAKKMKNKKKKSEIERQYEAMDRWIANPVKGPGDSEYDKYAYNL